MSTVKKLLPAVVAMGVLAAFTLFPPKARAEISSGKKTGIGFRQGFVSESGSPLPGINSQISLKHHLSGAQAISPYFGFQLSSNGGTEWGFSLGSRMYFDIIQEKFLDFFGFGGIGILLGSRETPQPLENDSETYIGFDTAGGVGTEFFFSGLPDLGFSFEAGMHFLFYHQDDSYIEIGTLGHFLTAGIHYYFQ